jgi:hypothetical protein
VQLTPRSGHHHSPAPGGAGFKDTIPTAAPAKLGPMNANLDPCGRTDAVMAMDGLFQVEGCAVAD